MATTRKKVPARTAAKAPAKKVLAARVTKAGPQSPLARTKESFGGKEALVDRILGVLTVASEDKDSTKARLLAVSNKKLLRLLRVSGEIKTTYGSAEKLAEAAADAVGKAKDAAYIARLTRLAQRTPARVLDLIKTASAKGATA